MRIFRLRTVPIVILLVIVAVVLWLLIPLHPSARKDILHGKAYITGTVRIKPIFDKPLSSIVSALPGNSSALSNVPFFVRPLIPPVIKFYLQGSREGEGWAVVADLGWRSRLFRMLHGIIIGQMQYRGMGAIEDEHVLRTPSGTKILFYQDGRTLFVAEGNNIIEKIIGPSSNEGTVPDRADIQKAAMETGDKRVIAGISFSNIDGDITRGIDMLESKSGFLLMPSAGSLIKGSVDLRQTGSDTIAGTILLTVREDGDFKGLESDVTYIIDLLDRFLSVQNMKTDSTINREANNLTIQIMIHPDGEKQ